MGGLHMEPFTFNIKAKNSHNRVIKKIYLQVSFKKLTKLFGFRIGGSSAPSKWGCVTKFAILYKIENKPNWSFYRDDFGAPRVSSSEHKNMSNRLLSCFMSCQVSDLNTLYKVVHSFLRTIRDE